MFSCGHQRPAMRISRWIHLSLGIMAFVVVASGQAPVNDNFADRIPLVGSSLTINGTLAGATLESGEPTNVCASTYFPVGMGSVWWTWTAPTSTPVTLALVGNYPVPSTVSWFQVLTGTNVGALAEVACNLFSLPTGRYAEFSAIAGTAYQIRAIGIISQPFTLQLTATNAPVVVTPPKNRTVSPYGSVLFSVLVAGLPAPTLQWTFNGTPLPGQTNISLALHGVTTNHAGSYSVIASNSGGVTESTPALLTIADTNPVPQLVPLPVTNSTRLNYTLTAEGGRWYKTESSSTLVSWTNATYLQITNGLNLLSVTGVNAVHHFVRATLNTPTDVCRIQLEQIRAAKNSWAIENKRALGSTVDTQQVIKYLNGQIPLCPEYGTYAWGAVGTDTDCSLRTAKGHVVTNAP